MVSIVGHLFGSARPLSPHEMLGHYFRSVHFTPSCLTTYMYLSLLSCLHTCTFHSRPTYLHVPFSLCLYISFFLYLYQCTYLGPFLSLLSNICLYFFIKWSIHFAPSYLPILSQLSLSSYLRVPFSLCLLISL